MPLLHLREVDDVRLPAEGHLHLGLAPLPRRLDGRLHVRRVVWLEGAGEMHAPRRARGGGGGGDDGGGGGDDLAPLGVTGLSVGFSNGRAGTAAGEAAGDAAAAGVSVRPVAAASSRVLATTGVDGSNVTDGAPRNFSALPGAPSSSSRNAVRRRRRVLTWCSGVCATSPCQPVSMPSSAQTSAT